MPDNSSPKEGTSRRVGGWLGGSVQNCRPKCRPKCRPNCRPNCRPKCGPNCRPNWRPKKRPKWRGRKTLRGPACRSPERTFSPTPSVGTVMYFMPFQELRTQIVPFSSSPVPCSLSLSSLSSSLTKRREGNTSDSK